MTSSELRRQLIQLIQESSATSGYLNLEIQEGCYTKGFAFFPYGDGLLENNAIPQSCIMVLGQDFGTEAYVANNNFKESGESEKHTMKNFLKIMGSELAKKCFFTNLFLGLRKDKKMIGMNPGLKKKETGYLELSFNFFERQVAEVKPKLIMVLGKVPYNFICEKLKKERHQVKRFADYFAKPEILEYKNIKLICIPHPSMMNSNKSKTSFNLEFIKGFIT